VMSSKRRAPTRRFESTALLAAVATLSGMVSSAVVADEMVRMDVPPILVSQIRAQSRLTISPGHAEIIRYKQEPGTVIIGDAEVAVASIVTSDILVLTGLRAGVTNVIVLDDNGAQIDQIVLRVAMPGTTVIVQRALKRQVLRCDPRCSPVDELGVAVEPALSVLAPPVAARLPETVSASGS